MKVRIYDTGDILDKLKTALSECDESEMCDIRIPIVQILDYQDNVQYELAVAVRKRRGDRRPYIGFAFRALPSGRDVIVNPIDLLPLIHFATMIDRVEEIRKIVRELATRLAKTSTVTVIEAKIAREVATEIKVYETETEKQTVAVSRKARYVTEEESEEEEEEKEEEKRFETGEKKKRG